MVWFWLNIPLMALVFAAICGIPMWLVIKHPDVAPVPTAGSAVPQAPAVALVASGTVARPALATSVKRQAA